MSGPCYTAKSVLLLKSIDEGLPTPEIFSFPETTVSTEDLAEGDILIEALAMSADPYLRGTIRSTGTNKAGHTIAGFIAGKVLHSKNSAWDVGDYFGASLPFSSFQIVSKASLGTVPIWKLSGYVDDSNISLGVGVLGMTGCTAHGGLLEVLRPKRGETLFVSAASGAVGALVGMLAKQLFNCKVIGSCGTDEKCRLVKEKYGFDHAINYKTVADKDSLIAALKEVAPEGIDMYFENVGGYHFEAAYASLRPKGRIAICGIISQYNDATVPKYEFDPVKAIYQQQRIEGFLCFDWLYEGRFVKEMGEFLKEGKIHSQETFFHGIEQWPAGFLSLFTGENVGKVVIKV